MRKVPKLVLLLTFVCGLIMNVGYVTSQVHAVEPDVADKATAEGSVAVIVGLNLPLTYEVEGNLSTRDIRAQRYAIAVVQQALIESLTGYDANVYKTYKALPYMAVMVDAVALQVLKESPLVTTLQEDIPEPPMLASSTGVIGMPDVWSREFEGQGQRVVILDTGIDAGHTFFGDRVAAEACFSNATNSQVSLCPNGQQTQTGDGSADATIPACDDNGTNICDHGTHVAGIAAGNGSNYDGVARGANIIAIQVFTRFNNSADCDPNDPNSAPCVKSYASDQLSALEYVFDTLHPDDEHNIASVNMSLGGGQYTGHCDTDSRKAAIDNLRSVEIATVISSGNDSYVDAVGAPGCISTAVTIGSTTDSDDISSFSNMADMVDLLAPGSDIDSSVPGGGFESKSGTSMAAPHVAGAWTVMKGINPPASVDDLERILEDTGVEVTDGRPNGTVIKPRIQLDDAIVDNIDILDIDTNAPAYAGPHNNPIKIIVKVTKPEDNLLPEKFGAVIGDRPSDVVIVYEGSDVYVLEILAPSQDTNGLYDLIVSVITDSALVAEKKNQVVHYADTNSVDVSLVIDRSGSMGSDGKMEAAKEAAKQFVDLMHTDDMIGVVSFDDIVTTEFALTTITSPDIQVQAKTAIDALYDRGATSIGGGLQRGQEQLSTLGQASHPWAIVLLSDGLENTAPMVADVLPGIVASKTVVHTVGLGPGADEPLMQDIASQTGGTYHFAPGSAELGGIYNTIAGAVSGQQVLFYEGGTVDPGVTDEKDVVVDSTVSEATFSINWANSGSTIDLTLRRPNGSLVDPGVAAGDANIDYVSGSTYQYYRVRSPDTGVWTMRTTGGYIPAGTGENSESYTAMVTGMSGLTMRVYLDQGAYTTLQPVKVAATLSDQSAIAGAKVRCDVLLPSPLSSLLAAVPRVEINGDLVPDPEVVARLAAASVPMSIGFSLYDDGAHGDGPANDGVYANSFYATTDPGTYSFVVEASGTSNSGDAFSRRATESVYVYGDPTMMRRIYLPLVIKNITLTPPIPTWSTGSGLSGRTVYALDIHPGDCNTLYAGSGSGVYKSANGGQTWTPAGLNALSQPATAHAPFRDDAVDSMLIPALAVHPANGQVVYAATWGAGVYKTANGGAAWVPVNNGLSGELWLYALALDAAGQALYAGTSDGGVYKTANGGASWFPVNTGLEDWYIRSLAADPTRPQVLYAGTQAGIYKTANGGASWEWAGEGLGTRTVWALAVNPANPQIVYAGVEGGGVYRTINGGATWVAVNTGLGTPTVYGLAVDPLTAGAVYAGTAGQGVYRSSNAGGSWAPANAGLGSSLIQVLRMDGAACHTLHAGTGNGVWEYQP